jgi:hypothetical protein
LTFEVKGWKQKMWPFTKKNKLPETSINSLPRMPAAPPAPPAVAGKSRSKSKPKRSLGRPSSVYPNSGVDPMDIAIGMTIANSFDDNPSRHHDSIPSHSDAPSYGDSHSDFGGGCEVSSDGGGGFDL